MDEREIRELEHEDQQLQDYIDNKTIDETDFEEH